MFVASSILVLFLPVIQNLLPVGNKTGQYFQNVFYILEEVLFKYACQTHHIDCVITIHAFELSVVGNTNTRLPII